MQTAASRPSTSCCSSLRIEYQSSNGATTSISSIRGMKINVSSAYVVLTYFFASGISLRARASASLFFSPLFMPMSKKLNQATIELMASHTP